jgi:hypothetical protein
MDRLIRCAAIPSAGRCHSRWLLPEEMSRPRRDYASFAHVMCDFARKPLRMNGYIFGDKQFSLAGLI